MISTHFFFFFFGSKMLWRWRNTVLLRKTERLKGNKKGDYKEYVQAEKNKLSRDAVNQAERMERQRWNTPPLRENEVKGENVRRRYPPQGMKQCIPEWVNGRGMGGGWGSRNATSFKYTRCFILRTFLCSLSEKLVLWFRQICLNLIKLSL